MRSTHKECCPCWLTPLGHRRAPGSSVASTHLYCQICGPAAPIPLAEMDIGLEDPGGLLGAELDTCVRRDAVSPEEIERLTVRSAMQGRQARCRKRASQNTQRSPGGLCPSQVPEGLPDEQRAALYAAGQPVQQRCLVDNLPALVAGGGAAAWAAVASRLPALAEAADEDGQVALAAALVTILRAQPLRLPPAVVADSILPLVLPRATDTAASPEQQEAWLACFEALAAALDRHAVHSRLVPAVQHLGSGAAAAAHLRCLCGRLLGALATALPPEGVDGLLLRPALDLCQVGGSIWTVAGQPACL